MIDLKYPFTTVRDRLIAMPRAWLGLVLLVIIVGFFFTMPFLLWSYHIERAGRLLDQALMWPEARQLDSLPQLGNPDALKAAEKQLAQAIYWRPTHPYAYRLTAQSYIAQGDWEDAVKIYEQAEKLSPKHPLLTWEKALVYEELWQEGATSAHSALIETWAELNLDAEALQARAREASHRGTREDSLRWYVRALQLGANLESGVAYGRYLLLQKQGDESAARARLEEAISYDTGWLSAIERFQAWSRWARLLFDDKQYSQAEGVLQQAIAVFPKNAQLEDIFSEDYRFLGLTQLKLAKAEAALESFQKAFEINNENVWAYVSYGQLLYELEPTKTAQSIQAFESALRLKSDDLQLWETLILYWRRAQEVEQANLLCELAATEQVAAEMADICQTTDALASSDWYYQSQTLSKEGKYEQATEALEEAITLDQGWFSPVDRFGAWSQWGRLLFENKHYPEAEEAFQHALAESADWKNNLPLSQSYRQLALTQIELAKPEAALENLAQAIDLDNQNLWAYVSYGQLLYELEPTKTAQASQAFESALRLKSDDLQLWQTLILYWRRAQEMEQVEVLCQLATTEQVGAGVAELCQVGAQASSDLYYQYLALLEQDKQSDASAALEQAISLDQGWFSPVERFEALTQWGRLLFENKRYIEAEEALQRALSASAEEIDNSLLSQSYRQLALIQLELAKPEAALENLAQAIDLDNQNLWAYVNYGQLLYELEPTKTAQASQAFESALRLKSDDLQLWETLILYWRRAQEMEQVEVLCQLAATEQVGAEVAELCQVGAQASSDLYYQYLALLEQDKQSDASAALEQAISRDEGWFSSADRFRAWYQWGRLLFDNKRYPEAEEALQRALSASAEEIDNSLLSQSYRQLALTQLELAKPEAALENLAQAIGSDNQNLWAYISYGQLLYELEPTKTAQASQAFESALRLKSDDLQLWQDLILYWRRAQEMEQVEVLCQLATTEQRAADVAELCQVGTLLSGDLYYQHLALLAQDKESDAYTALEQAISLDEGWFSPVERFRAWFQWGKTRHQKREFAESERIFKETVARYPENVGQEGLLSDIYRFMAESQNYQGRSDDALDAIQLSLQWNEKNLWAHIFFGQVLYLNNPSRIEEVNEAFAAALSLQENDPVPWRSLIVFWRTYDEERRAAELCEQVVKKQFAEELSDMCQ